MKKVMGVLMVACSMLAGCASGGGITQRGTVVVDSAAARAFAEGPAVVHAFSQDKGGRVFMASVVSGTDTDCAAPQARNHGAGRSLLADEVSVVTIASGQVACIATSNRRTYELLWHAKAAAPSTAPIALARR